MKTSKNERIKKSSLSFNFNIKKTEELKELKKRIREYTSRFIIS